jgi:cobalt-zinc-cadmium efflux system protein
MSHHDDRHGRHEHDHAHDHGDHGRSRGAGHVHSPASFGKAFAIGIALNAGFVVLEVVYGLLSNSVALLADAGHNMSDVLGLAVAWAAAVLSKRAPTQRFTYGLGGTSILAALFNASFLLVIVGGLSWEAIGRFWDPQPIAGKTVMIVAAIGIVINGVCAWLFASGRAGDLNIRGAFAHMAADALVSVGVVVAALVIVLTGWIWLDPAVSLIINAIIIWGTWGLLRDSVTMSLNAVPAGLETN